MSDSKLAAFDIVCHECTRAGIKDQSTNLYINWQKHYYIVRCLRDDCGVYEIYDEKGNRIIVPEGEEIDGTVEDKKLPN